jgi:hypothetical protein
MKTCRESIVAAKKLAEEMRHDVFIWDTGRGYHVTEVAVLTGWRLVARYDYPEQIWSKPITTLITCTEEEVH